MNYPNPHGPSCPWYSFAEATGSPNVKWCEETLCQWVSEPANTWSNLGYIAVSLGLFFWARSKRHPQNLRLFPVVVLVMGAISFFYHQSNFYGTQVLDFVGMFIFVGWVSGMNLVRARKLQSRWLLSYMGIYTAVLTLVLHGMYVTGLKIQVLMLIGALLIVITEILATRVKKVTYPYFFASLGLLGAALTCSLLDHTRVWCDPAQHGVFSQGHAWWHWLSSVAMITIYLHYSQPLLCGEQNTAND